MQASSDWANRAGRIEKSLRFSLHNGLVKYQSVIISKKKKGDCFMETMTIIAVAIVSVAAIVSNVSIFK